MVRCIRPASLRPMAALLPFLLIGATHTAASPSPAAGCSAFASLPGRTAAVGAAGPSSSSAFLGRGMRLAAPGSGTRGGRRQQQQQRRRGTGMSMFLGQDSGILGVGAPEIAVIVLVGYFILGPTELYKLTKDIGKTIQSFRSLSTEASKSFTSTMENQLELDELRKAQRELNEAFSFRRSINTDEDMEAFEPIPQTETAAAAAATANIETAGDATSSKRKKIKRRRKKTEPTPEEVAAANGEAGTGGEVPDLDMMSAFDAAKQQDEESALLREERKARLASGSQPGGAGDAYAKPDWFDDRGVEDLAAEGSSSSGDIWAESKAEEQTRFAAQLSGDWNESVLQNEDKLSPLAKIMDRLAILEEEKKAAELRLEEEFRLRGEMEEKFYQQKRDLLEEAAAEVQAEAYAGMGTGGSDDDAEKNKGKEGSASKTATKESSGESYLGSL